jgi:deoxyribodipyrimidine photolyase-related protein
MGNEVTLIFPHQLFKEHPALDKNRKVFLIEDPLFFGDIRYPLKFHKKKLIFHRASMKAYEKYLTDKGFDVVYLQYSSFKEDRRSNYLAVFFNKMKVNVFHYVDVIDFILEKRIQRMLSQLHKRSVKYASPMFLTDENYLRNYFLKHKSYLMVSFYKEQRKRLNILVDNNKPIGGKWSYDEENRKKLPKGIVTPRLSFPDDTEFELEAIDYVENYFTYNPGDGFDFIYPINFQQAEDWLEDFLNNRFKLFGNYEDAIDKDETYLFHSVLTPMLNSGLLTPSQVIEKALKIAGENKIPVNSLEGFIRQIIGWREYVRAVYVLEGVKQRTTNFFQLSKKLPKVFYTGATGIEPVDIIIKRVIKKAYTHHIERLMVLGNFMLLCEIDPNEVYKWFMEMYADAYDWVMVPNVYGMSQYADGGLMSTKPYISSSNYIRKMSNFNQGDWCEVWDSLYWRFIYNHKEVLEKNPRMSLMVRQMNKMDKTKLKNYLRNGEKYLSSLK